MMKKAFPILAVSIFSSMLGVGIIAPLLPIYADNLGATGIWIGIVFGGFSVSRAIVMPFVGKLSDRYGRKRFICIGLISYAFISLGFIWADSVYQLVLVRFLQGAAAGMIIPIAQAYIGDIAPWGEEGKWMGYFNTAFFAGLGLGPLMGGALSEHFGMSVAFYTMGALNLAAFLIAIVLLPDNRVERTATQVLSFKIMGASSIIKGLFSFRMTNALIWGAFIAFLPIFATTYIELSPTLTGMLLAVSILLLSSLQIYSGKVADRFNRRTLVIIGSLVSLTFLALIPLTHSFWPLLGLCALTGLGSAISLPAALALTVEEGRKFGMGSTMAMFTMAMSIGMVIGPVVGGMMVDWVSINSVFYFAAGMGLVGTSLFAWFTRKIIAR